jgi:hypothetical protein
MAFAVVLAALWCAGRVGVGPVGCVWVVGLGRREGGMLGGGGGDVWLGVGVFGRGCVVWTAA